MDKTYTFTVQIDAPRDISEREIALAIHQAVEYAKENYVPGARVLNSSDIGQVTVL